MLFPIAIQSPKHPQDRLTLIHFRTELDIANGVLEAKQKALRLVQVMNLVSANHASSSVFSPTALIRPIKQLADAEGVVKRAVCHTNIFTLKLS